MADNGTGGDLSIPAFLISESNGQILYDALNDP